jgi:hypothetical protein
MFLVDAGPNFAGWTGDVEGVSTCAIPSVVLIDETAKAQTAAVMRGMGARCHDCPIGCPIARR